MLFVKKNFIIKGKAHKYLFEVINCLFCTYLLMFKFWLHNNGSVLVALLKILCMYWSSSRDSFGVQMFTIKLQIRNKIWQKKVFVAYVIFLGMLATFIARIKRKRKQFIVFIYICLDFLNQLLVNIEFASNQLLCFLDFSGRIFYFQPTKKDQYFEFCICTYIKEKPICKIISFYIMK